jgi:fluoroquinolone resistance protein
MSFTEDVYYKAKFPKLSLENASVQFKIFEECEFTGCNFVSCKFKKCKFINCSFNDCTISDMVPFNCRFNEVKFARCKVMGVDWTKTEDLRGLDFSSCQINYSNFRMLKIPKTKLIVCEAKEVDFTEADLNQSDFQRTDFEKSLFFKTNLSQSDFRGAKNYYIDIKNNVIKKAHFSLPEAMSLLKSLDIIIDW